MQNVAAADKETIDGGRWTIKLVQHGGGGALLVSIRNVERNATVRDVERDANIKGVGKDASIRNVGRLYILVPIYNRKIRAASDHFTFEGARKVLDFKQKKHIARQWDKNVDQFLSTVRKQLRIKFIYLFYYFIYFIYFNLRKWENIQKYMSMRNEKEHNVRKEL